MKAKLNLTIAQELIPVCKEYAQSQGLSVSQLVEELLRGLTEKEETAFSKKWRGKFKASGKQGPKYDKLRERFLS